MITLQTLDSVEKIAEFTFGLLKQSETSALSFGSTYEDIFHLWRQLWKSSGKPSMPAFFPADERLVDYNDGGSNWRTVCETFLNKCGTPEDLSRWASDADTYRQFLAAKFGKASPVFDLIFLGLGPDGHTASLFPNDCPGLSDPAWNKTVLQTEAPFIPPKRLTLGPGVIARAKTLVLTVTGDKKADIFARFYNELLTETESLPPALIIKAREALDLDTLILCDRPAAAQIRVRK